MKYIEQFPFEHEVIEEWIPLSDGTKLWMKRWMPQTNHPVPAILEYLPYRAGDWTAPRDYERHPFYAGHGYASIRVDIRGHGNSEGVPGDEYSPQEHADGVEVINWIAQQDWCTGNVGMFGISWGGFNSLQLAALHPEPLKAIVTTCSTDDRYDNDVHYLGGSMLGVDMHAWAATMLAFESRPLDKRVWGGKVAREVGVSTKPNGAIHRHVAESPKKRLLLGARLRMRRLLPNKCSCYGCRWLVRPVSRHCIASLRTPFSA